MKQITFIIKQLMTTTNHEKCNIKVPHIFPLSQSTSFHKVTEFESILWFEIWQEQIPRSCALAESPNTGCQHEL